MVSISTELSRSNEAKPDIVEIVSRIKEDTRLIKLAKSAGKNSNIQDKMNLMIEKLRLGNE